MYNAHSKEQHQKTVTDGLQRTVDVHDGRPDRAALEVLRRFRDKQPYLGQLIVPGGQRIFKIGYNPVVAQC